jgi:type I restriction enzyme S subunit
MSMSVPPREEQERVVRALELAKRETSLLREQLEALRRQKRGIMQKLLDGEWRLPVAAVRSARKTRS